MKNIDNFRAIVASASQPILAVHRDGRIAMANPAAERVYGYGGEEFLTLSLETLLPARYRERHAAHLRAWFLAPSGRPMSSGVDFTCVRKSGAEFPAEVSLSSMQTSSGTIGVAFISDVSERKRSEQALREHQQRLERLTGALITAQENENRDLARELHDVFSQDLATAAIKISTLMEQAKSQDELVAGLSEIGKRIARLADDMHSTARSIHPAVLEDLGLEPALRQECESFRRRSGISTRFIAKDVPAGLSREVRLCLYRVAQECLRNIGKHSLDATRVEVLLAGSPAGVVLRITDTGAGFDPAGAIRRRGLGLISMEERLRLVNGTLNIQSQPGQGTIVAAFIPARIVPVEES